MSPNDEAGMASSPADQLEQVDVYLRAANYLAAGQIYLMDNALLRRPLVPEDVKPRLLGHWGTSPGLNFLYAHLSRVDQGSATSVPSSSADRGTADPRWWPIPGLRGPTASSFLVWRSTARAWLGCSVKFSFPGGIPSHCSPGTPGSIHEGGELGYALSHAFGAAFDNPDLVVACVVGDGEAETGPAATGWHSNKFLDPRRDGAVLPILHLNGYKIAAPTVLARIPTDELLSLFTGYGYRPVLVEGGFDGEEPSGVHARMATSMDSIVAEIREIQESVAEARCSVASRVAHAHPSNPEGLDRAKGGGRATGRRNLSIPPASPDRGSDKSRPSGPARGVAPELPTPGLV